MWSRSSQLTAIHGWIVLDDWHSSWLMHTKPGTPKRVRSLGCWLVDPFFRCLHSTARTKPPTHPIGFAEMLCIHDRFTSLHSNRKCRRRCRWLGWEFVSETSWRSWVPSSFPESPPDTYRTVPYDLMKHKWTARICPDRCDIRSCACVWDILQPKTWSKDLASKYPLWQQPSCLCGSCQDSQPVQDLGNFILKTWMKQQKEMPTFAKWHFHFCIPCCFTNLSCYTCYVTLCYATRDGWCLKEPNPCLTCAKSRFLLVFGKKGAANLEFTKLTCNPTDELKVKKLPWLIHWSVLSPT